MTDRGEARAEILGRIRTVLGAERIDRARRSAVARRLERHPRGTIPARAEFSGNGRLTLFKDMLVKQGADVSRVATPKEAVGAIASYLGTCNLPPRLRMGADPILAALPWREAWDIERSFGAAQPGDRASLSRATAAAAETGTLFLLSGRDNPTTLNFLPEAHTVLVAAADIAGSYEEAWDHMRDLLGEGALPRSVNLISGPSRTADIEQTIVRGAHGPRRLHVLIVAEI
jgi:L-lactate dehydrogenase complex protein LldG